MHTTNNLNLNITFEFGLPSHDFFEKAWADEPLTNVLKETNVPFALPAPVPDISLVAKINSTEVIGQRSMNKTATYWNHIIKIEPGEQNLSTQLFIKIHKKAVEAEKEHLVRLNEPVEKSYHDAGIAVLPEYRGKNIGLSMTLEQLKLCREQAVTTLFCETTNKYSAALVQKAGFTKITEYPYSQLSDELNCPDLKSLNDSFSVWCLKIPTT